MQSLGGQQTVRDECKKKRYQPRNIAVSESTPKGIFDQAGIDALQQWRYHVTLDELDKVIKGQNLIAHFCWVWGCALKVLFKTKPDHLSGLEILQSNMHQLAAINSPAVHHFVGTK
ncbi:hypothetical protein C3B51_19260 [Pseudoalteromonas rubra]|uniref:Uncharacterized protein n=1 Tax=Pseudoalteromonas rubra TaxID=43658 RepID=A0A4Q7E1H0_9GAMM|nr:hypothetical protein [Pseudoalteromonas rubra]RZM74923.1 hypothetical protein C3B51_19260 [Pseudoalteromonas rubra]